MPKVTRKWSTSPSSSTRTSPRTLSVQSKARTDSITLKKLPPVPRYVSFTSLTRSKTDTETASKSKLVSSYLKRSPFMVKFFGLCLLTVIINLIVVGIFILYSTFFGPQDPVCRTKICLDEAQRLSKQIDPSINPCLDFHKFACRDYESSEIPSGAQRSFLVQKYSKHIDNQLKISLMNLLPKSYSQLSNAEKIVVAFYKKCIAQAEREEGGINEFIEIIQKYSPFWPLKSNSSQSSRKTMIENIIITMTNLTAHGINNILFQTSAVIKNGIRMIKIVEPTWHSDAIIVSRDLNGAIGEAYLDFMVEICSNLTSRKPSEIREDLKKVRDHEIYLAKIAIEVKEDQTIPLGDGAASLIKFLQPYYGNKTVDFNTRFFTNNHNYLIDLIYSLNRGTDLKAILNLITWRLISSLDVLFTQDMRMAQRKFLATIDGRTSIPNPPDLCTDYVKRFLKPASIHLYLNYKKQEKDKLKNLANELINNARQSFIEMLRTTKLMSKITREGAIRKMNSAAFIFEYFSKDGLQYSMANKEFIGMYYQKVTVLDEFDVELPLVNITLAILNVNRERDSAFLNLEPKVAATYEGEFDPMELDLIRYDGINTVYLPLGLIDAVGISRDLPMYMNFGALGKFIGWLLHSLVSGSEQFRDWNGSIVNWNWKHYNSQTGCFRRRYSAYYRSKFGKEPDFNNTSMEYIINDYIALQIAFKAHKRYLNAYGPQLSLLNLTQYTPDQLFFIKSAQHHCGLKAINSTYFIGHNVPQDFYNKEPTSNFDQFYTTFNCSDANIMNQVGSCVIF